MQDVILQLMFTTKTAADLAKAIASDVILLLCIARDDWGHNYLKLFRKSN